MLGHKEFVLLLLVLINIELGRSRINIVNQKQTQLTASEQKTTVHLENSMPKDLFSSMRKMTSTRDFLVQMNMYQQEKKKGNLPSQMKKLKSRIDGLSLADMISTEIQTCKVRPHIHFLPQPPHSENAFIWPYAVKIPRCGGSCSARREILQCRGMDKFNISVPSYKVSYHSSRKRREVMDEFAKLKDPIHELSKRSAKSPVITPQIVQVEGDKNCKCECTKTSDTCAKEGKVINQDHCQCQCNETKQCDLPYEWDANTCTCVCGTKNIQKNARDCYNSNNKKRWNQEKCACLCPNPTLNCRGPNTFDSNTCECTCVANVKCPSNKLLLTIPGTKMCWCF